MVGQMRRRQRLRKLAIIVSFLLFPITLNYFSPYLIIASTSQGIVNGSLVVFGLMFLSALFLGRAWCGWACPAAGMGEVCFAVNNRPARGGRLDWIKWLIWGPWLGAIVAAAISAGGYRAGDLFFNTDGGISVGQPAMYIVYYLVIGVFMGLALLAGRRAGCHYICWMAPFMVLGRKLRNLFSWPALRLRVEPEKCINCRKCTQSCPMSLDVNAMVQKGAMENSECVLCMTCVDTCPKGVIHTSFSAGQ